VQHEFRGLLLLLSLSSSLFNTDGGQTRHKLLHFMSATRRLTLRTKSGNMNTYRCSLSTTQQTVASFTRPSQPTTKRRCGNTLQRPYRKTQAFGMESSTGFATPNNANLVVPSYNLDAIVDKITPVNTTPWLSFLTTYSNSSLSDSNVSRNTIKIAISNCSPEGTCLTSFACVDVSVCDVNGNAATAKRC
jgi:hypothetical protein